MRISRPRQPSDICAIAAKDVTCVVVSEKRQRQVRWTNLHVVTTARSCSCVRHLSSLQRRTYSMVSGGCKVEEVSSADGKHDVDAKARGTLTEARAPQLV